MVALYERLGLESNGQLLQVVAILSVVYYVALVTYRLWFHPLAAFPGPKLIAASTWYETICDIIYHDFPERLNKLHQKYGPIIRVGPDELHINDADYFLEVFASAAKHRTDIIPPRGLGMDASLGSTPGHELHQMRRKPLEKFLSRQNVQRIQTCIHEEIRTLDRKVLAAKGTGVPLRLDHAFMSFTGDIVGEIACGESPQLLDAPNFTPEWYNMIRGAARVIPLLRHFPQVGIATQWVPADWVAAIFPNSTGFKILQLLGATRVKKIAAEVKKEQSEEGSSMFHQLLRSDIPDVEKHPNRLADEAVSFLGAGTFPTAATLIFTAYNILSHPEVEARLRKELTSVMSNFDDEVPDYVDVEQVEYLAACLKEGLRLLRLFRRKGRISIDEDLVYQKWTIPKGTPVTMSVYSLHVDPEVYPDPLKYDPERWLGDRYNPQMDRNWNPFLKGSRICIGMNVAWAQMYLVLATLFRPNKKYRLALGDCDDSDIYPVWDNEFGVATGDRGLVAVVN
ncbi:putative benzoate 4-monooxygenase cytochrome P450 [Xylaria cubensis]|nr:putative benzoate 4-monooxygenase cytochrome P450 [Xylaria cubensis]